MKIIIHSLFIIGFNSSLIAQLQDTVTVLKQLDSLVNVAQSMNHKGDQINALKAFEQALILGQSGLPNNHLQIGNLFHQKGLQQLTLSENEPAWESLQEALRIKKMHLGEIDASVAKTLNALGLVSQNLEKFEIAEAYFLKAREIWKQTLGIDHEQYGWVQHNLGRLYSRLERDEEAETCLKDALRIKEMKEPSDSPDLGHTLVILAEVYKRQGKIKEWQSSILRASSIWEKQKGINDQLYYWSRHNLAMYYQFMGDLQKAKSLAWEAVNGKEELLGPDDPDLAYSLIILANIYSFIGELDSTRMLELRAKGIYEKQNDQNEVEYAWVLNNLGLNDLYQKRYDSARVYLYQSLQLKRTLLGEENADYQITAINYGRVLIKSGALDSAQLTLGRVKMYYEQHGLTSHEDYLYCLDELIDIYIIQGNYIQTMEIISKINSITESQLNEISKLASENELFYYNSSSQYYSDRYLSCFYLFRNQYSNAGTDLYNNILFHKGYVLNSSLSMRYSILRNPFLKEKFDSLVHLNKYLAKAYASTNTHPKDLSDVENKANEVEKELVGSVSSLNTSYEKNSWEKLKSFLQPDEIAVDFIQFHYFPSYQTDSIFYVAVITRPDEKEPIIIPLFEERKLKVLINTGKDQRQEPMNKVYLENGQALYDLIWKPIVAYLENVLTIYFSPTGLLNQLNPEAIGPNLEKLMLDRYKMIQLGNMHELFDQNKTEPVVSGEALLLGGITYSLDTTFIGEKLPSTHLSEERPDLSGISYTLRGIENKDWKYLPGSDKEIKQIEYILKKTGLHPKIYSGSLAGEKVLKELFLPDSMYVSPYLIHFSTHGYFFPDPKQNNESMSDKASSSFQISNNPLIRSGLILAGGNYAWTHGHPFKPGMEDGILTAYEISQMDLRNTELVVLSACDTGLGDIEGNEGVYGLQRAFKIAGVKNLIMSLWQVPDAATAQLMTLFYKHWLEDKMTIREALHTAQKEMRDQGMEPYEWAGFVLVE